MVCFDTDWLTTLDASSPHELRDGAVAIRWTPHPVIVTIRDNNDYVRIFLYACDTSITGCGVLLSLLVQGFGAFGEWEFRPQKPLNRKR